MDKYAVVKIAGHQHKVTEGMVLDVERLPNKEGENIELSPVLLLCDDGYQVGTPALETKIKALVVKHLQGQKIEIYKYKSKVRYRRHTGFRPQLTQIKIETIGEKRKEIKKAEPKKDVEKPQTEKKTVKKVTKPRIKKTSVK